MFWKKSMEQTEAEQQTLVRSLKQALTQADAVVLGAGAGLSTSAGFTYAGERFQRYFFDFARRYGIGDMYSGGFCSFETPEEHWAYWSRFIYVNRYMDPPKPVYDKLFELVKDKDYFVLTTNVDHCFQKAGFAKKRMFYTQGDYGLFQCSEPCCQETYDNEDTIRKMVEAQGFVVSPGGMLTVPEKGRITRTVPTELVPRCPHCGKPMTMNLRSDDKFVEDEGWHVHAEYYSEFLRRHKNVNTLFLELAVGYNTPTIIKFSFWRMTHEWPNATYACLNRSKAYAPEEIAKKSICINGDIGDILNKI
jgi:NAD-dependent SIR2 family protein deacetylase